MIYLLGTNELLLLVVTLTDFLVAKFEGIEQGPNEALSELLSHVLLVNLISFKQECEKCTKGCTWCSQWLTDFQPRLRTKPGIGRSQARVKDAWQSQWPSRVIGCGDVFLLTIPTKLLAKICWWSTCWEWLSCCYWWWLLLDFYLDHCLQFLRGSSKAHQGQAYFLIQWSKTGRRRDRWSLTKMLHLQQLDLLVELFCS